MEKVAARGCRALTVSVLFLFCFLGVSKVNADSTPVPVVPAKGMVTMVDLGAKECIPCKMMAPILEELEREYKDRAAIVFLDVRKNVEMGRKYGIRAIPTQIFYDKEGQEVSRHEGFMDKKSIVAMLEKLGVKQLP